jgi:uncharacterized protein (TIGR03067 family)
MNPYAATLLVAGLLVPAAPAPKEEDDAKKLQGTWRCVCWEREGGVHKDGNAFVCVIEKDTIVLKDESKSVKWTFTLDPTKKPKAITLTFKDGPKPEEKPNVLHGIYEVDKDGIKWCLTGAGEKDRPKEFATRDGSPHEMFTFKREKP